ncbi:MAG: mechanosensitive ion channel family protein [bacterium]
MTAQSDPTSLPEQPQMGIEGLLGLDQYQTYVEQGTIWAKEHLLVYNTGLQLGLMLAALIPAIIFAPRLKRLIIDQLVKRVPVPVIKKLARALATLAIPVALYFTLCVFIAAMAAAGEKVQFMETGRSLLTAWILVRFVTLIIASQFWSKVAFYTIWPIMALDAFHVLDDVMAQLAAMKVVLDAGPTDAVADDVSISLLDVVKAALVFALLFWVANFASKFLTKQINDVEELNPSLKTLFSKILDLVLPIIALIMSLQLVGFNLGTLAIFGGAIGLGIGLGLQRLVSNFAAGVTLLMDKSIKPGDTIKVENSFGWVTAMNTRYVAVRTRDGTEHLIPNDIFIENGVINWSHADKFVRIHAPFSISYKYKDVRFVQKMAQEAALSLGRVVEKPAPRCNLVEFGDSSINFDLRFWIVDPQNGVTNIRSDVMMAVWDALNENGIEVPFPQRDIHIKTGQLPTLKAPLDE